MNGFLCGECVYESCSLQESINQVNSLLGFLHVNSSSFFNVINISHCSSGI